VPKEYIPAIEKGVREAMLSGIIAGYPVVDVKVMVVDGSYHEVDSNENAFKQAGRIAFQEGMKKANPVLKEPIMHVEVTTPENHVGDVVGDLNGRRGRIESMEPGLGGTTIVNSHVPLSEMFGYVTRNVRLRDDPALADAGPRDPQRDPVALRRSTAEHCDGDHRQGPERTLATPREAQARNGAWASFLWGP